MLEFEDKYSTLWTVDIVERSAPPDRGDDLRHGSAKNTNLRLNGPIPDVADSVNKELFLYVKLF